MDLNRTSVWLHFAKGLVSCYTDFRSVVKVFMLSVENYYCNFNKMMVLIQPVLPWERSFVVVFSDKNREQFIITIEVYTMFQRVELTTLALIVIIVGVLFPTTLFSQSTISVLKIEGPLPDESLAEFNELLIKSISENPKYQVSDEDMSFSEAMLINGCIDDSVACLAILARGFGNPFFVYGKILEASESYTVIVNLYDAEKKETVVFHRTVDKNADIMQFFETEMGQFLGGKTEKIPTHLKITSVPLGAEVWLNGKNRGVTPLEVETDLGESFLLLRLANHKDWKEKVTLLSGSSKVVTANLEPIEVAKPVDPIEKEVVKRKKPVVSWILAGVGVVGVGAGVYFGLDVLKKEDAFSQTHYHKEAYQLKEDGETKAILANIFIGAGSAAIVASLLVYFLTDLDEKENSPVSLTTGYSTTGDPILIFQGSF